MKTRHDFENAEEAASFIRTQLAGVPHVAVFTGTGLNDLFSSVAVEAALKYGEIPHFPVATVPSHQGRLESCEVAGRDVLLMRGRCHLYEGYTPRAATFPIRVLQALGIKRVVLTNAAGGLNPLFAPGHIMIIEDHINLTGCNPLAGPNEDRWGPRFPDMTHAYCGRLRELAQTAAGAMEIDVQKGVYAGLKGPSLETPAEMRFLRAAGAEAVGFSTVMETIAAVHAGMEVLGLSVITNMCLPDLAAPARVDEILSVARAATQHLETIITGVIERSG